MRLDPTPASCRMEGCQAQHGSGPSLQKGSKSLHLALCVHERLHNLLICHQKAHRYGYTTARACSRMHKSIHACARTHGLQPMAAH